MAKRSRSVEELPADNAARVAIFDALTTLSRRRTASGVGEDVLFDQVIGRLRMLVPRELHVSGERPYFDEKIAACIQAGIVERSTDGARRLVLTGVPPRVMYPDGTVRDYEAGLEEARERLNADDQRLRRSGFDVHALVPEPGPRSKDFQGLVESMREHGFLKQFPIVVDVDGGVIDGRSRMKAAEIAKEKVVQSPESTRIPRRLATPLLRTVLFLDLNRGRLDEEQQARIIERLAEKAERPWESIQADLRRTRDWRLAPPTGYSSAFEFEKVPYADPDGPQVTVTTDGRHVVLGTLMRAVGLQGHKRDELGPFVTVEQVQAGGPKAWVLNVDNALEGIDAMMRERSADGLVVSPGWKVARDWLASRRDSKGAERRPAPELAGSRDA